MGSSSREAAARVTDVDTGHSGGSASLSTDLEGEEALAEEAVSEEITDEAEATEEETEATANDENTDLTADESDSETESSESDPEVEPTEEELAEIEAMAAAAGGSGHNGPPTAIITGSSNVMINGLPAARLGDILEPHHPGVRTICEGSPSVLINGQPASRVTDAIDCGGTIATGSDNVFIGNSPTLAAPSDASLPDIVFPNERSPNPGKKINANKPAAAVNAQIDTVSYTNTTHTNDTNVRIEGSPSSLTTSKQHALEYWNNLEVNATSFPEAFGARLMRLNAEAGYDAAEGVKNLYETFTDWNKFKSTVDGMYNTVANPRETYKALRAAAQSFSDLPGDQKGEAAYKMLLGTLAGGGVAKAGAATVGKKVVPNNNVRFSGGANRNTTPLTSAQQQDVLNYAKVLGTDADNIKFYSYDAPSNYSDLLDTVFVGPDIYPGSGITSSVVDRLSMRATLAHEVVGHRYSTLAGRDFAPGSYLDEFQASYRAARLAPDLTSTERFQLLKDSVRRLHSENITVKQFKESDDFTRLYLD